MYIFYKYRSPKLKVNCTTEADCLKNFLPLQHLKSFVVHDSVVCPRYMMESDNGSLSVTS